MVWGGRGVSWFVGLYLTPAVPSDGVSCRSAAAQTSDSKPPIDTSPTHVMDEK